MTKREFFELALITGKIEAISTLIEVECTDKGIKLIAGKNLKEVVDELTKFREENVDLK